MIPKLLEENAVKELFHSLWKCFVIVKTPRDTQLVESGGISRRRNLELTEEIADSPTGILVPIDEVAGKLPSASPMDSCGFLPAHSAIVKNGNLELPPLNDDRPEIQVMRVCDHVESIMRERIKTGEIGFMTDLARELGVTRALVVKVRRKIAADSLHNVIGMARRWQARI